MLVLAWLAMLTMPMRQASGSELTQDQQRQLASATDGSAVLDEAAWYPLLHDAATWGRNAEANARIPDYQAILENPDAHRGEKFLIEGELVRRMAFAGTSRPGPWEGKLQQWGIKHGSIEDTVVVYLVDPPDVREGAVVRLPARFYKVWATPDQQGVSSLFLVFVGKGAKMIRQGSGAGSGGLAKYMTVPVVMVVLLGAGLYMVRRHARESKQLGLTPAQRIRQMRGKDPFGIEPDDELEELDNADATPLPPDPASALTELHRRADQSADGP